MVTSTLSQLLLVMLLSPMLGCAGAEPWVSVDAAVKDGSSENDGSGGTDGPADSSDKDGPADSSDKDGPADSSDKDGPADSSDKDGPADSSDKDGPQKDGPQKDGPQKDGPQKDGPLADSGPSPDSGDDRGALDRGPDARVVDLANADVGRDAARDTVVPDSGADAPMDMVGPDGAALPALFFHDFEDSDGGLSASGDWAWGRPSFLSTRNCTLGGYSAPPGAYSGGKVWGTSLDKCHALLGSNNSGSCGAGDNSRAATLSFFVTLNASLTAAQLRYFQYVDLRMPSSWAEVRVDGKVERAYCASADNAPRWHQQVIDLSAHIGKTIAVSYHLASPSSAFADKTYTGWYIDDIGVYGK
jgi:hypothetical protein